VRKQVGVGNGSNDVAGLLFVVIPHLAQTRHIGS